MTTQLAYRYGLLPPLDWGPDCEEEVDRMIDLWNRLVDIEEKTVMAVRSIAENDPIASAATAEAERIASDLTAAREARKRARKQGRAKVPTPELDVEIARLSSSAKEAWAKVKEARRAARAASATAMREIEARRRSAVKAARQNSGLFWGNYNAVILAYEAARKRCLASGAILRKRDHRYRDCRIVNQIQCGGTWDEALTGTLNGQVSIRPRDLGRVKNGRPRPLYLLTMTIYTRGRGDRRTVSWPMVLHRPLPENARIQMVTVSRRHLPGRRPMWSVTFSLRLPDATLVHDGTGSCGVDIGWRKVNDGLRIATVVGDSGERSFVTLPSRICDAFRYADELSSEIDNRTSTRMASIKSLPSHGAPDDFIALVREAGSKRAPRPGDLARIVNAWPEGWQTEARDRAARDVRYNRRDRREQTGLRLRMRRARLDHYRCAALAIAKRYRLIGIEDIDVTKLAAREENPIPEIARYHRQIAAPGEFLAALRHAARKTGAVVSAHSGRSTWTCHECGAEIAPRDPSVLIATCPSCLAVWDQDVNAAKNLLAAASADMEGKTRAALAPQNPVPYEGRWQRAKRLAAEKTAALATDVVP